jgi:hypothetical protein
MAQKQQRPTIVRRRMWEHTGPIDPQIFIQDYV